MQLLFTGHMDTVFGADHAFQQTRWLEDGVLNGPGVADMKGGIAVMLAALKAVERSRGADRFGYEVVINSDEEVGSLASAALLAQAAQGKRAALTYEPAALPDGTLAGARPGSGNFAIVVHGRSAHAGRNPEDGRNALLAAADLALRLDRLKRDGLTRQPVADRGREPEQRRPRPRDPARQHAAAYAGRSRTQPKREIDEAVAAVAAERDVEIELSGGFGRPPKPLTPEAEALFNLVKQAGADLGQTIAWQPSGGVCDGNNIAACGVPVVDTMGVRGGKIHSMEEFLITESLGERAALVGADHPAADAGGGMSLPRAARDRRRFQRHLPDGEADRRRLHQPAARPADARRQARHVRTRASRAKEDSQAGDLYVFVLEDPKTRQIRGTCQVFGQVGVSQPFYSYHLSTLTQTSPELGKTFRNQLLSLTTDLEGSSEVGGLFLHPEMRAGGLGAAARAQPLFVHEAASRAVRRPHPGRASRSHGRSRARALLGRARRQLLRDELPRGRRVQCRPRHPIHRRPDAASADLCGASRRRGESRDRPAASRAAARRCACSSTRVSMFDRYVDIFDGGPTVTARTDDIRTVREARDEQSRRNRRGRNA